MTGEKLKIIPLGGLNEVGKRELVTEKIIAFLVNGQCPVFERVFIGERSACGILPEQFEELATSVATGGTGGALAHILSEKAENILHN